MPNPEPSVRTREVFHADLRDKDDFTKNFILDHKPFNVPLGISGMTDGTPANLQSMGNGNPDLQDINTSDIGSLVFATADIHGFRVELPYDMCVKAECGFRVKWQKIQNIAAATGGCLWTLTYEQKQIGVSTTGAGIAATALTVPIANSVDLARYVSQWTNIGTIAAGSLNALTAGTDCLDCSLLATLDTITDGTLDAIQLWYRPRVL